MSLHQIVHLAKGAGEAFEAAKKSDNPAAGAGLGALASGAGTTAGLAAVGLALTPVGWALALGVGAAAGAAYVMGKKSK